MPTTNGWTSPTTNGWTSPTANGWTSPTTNGWTSPTAIAAYTTATPPGDSALASRLVGEPITFQSVPLVKLEKF
ncbi:MAG: hypothetical protein HYY33_05340 [Chloroflexi bacterium]|nr:hypothetical protein [Chloroflexota bacterium]